MRDSGDPMDGADDLGPGGPGGDPAGDKTPPWVVMLVVSALAVGLLVYLSWPRFGVVRSTSPSKTMTNNLRQIASAADQFFLETGATAASLTEVVGTDRYVKALPRPVAGERYDVLFPITAGFSELAVTTSDGQVFRHAPRRRPKAAP